MIKKILDNSKYVKELKKELGNLRYIANANQDSVIKLNEEKRELENINTSLKAKIRELTKDKEILEFRLQRIEKENLECIKIKNELEDELRYYKKSLKRVYQGNNHISMIASSEMRDKGK